MNGNEALQTNLSDLLTELLKIGKIDCSEEPMICTFIHGRQNKIETLKDYSEIIDRWIKAKSLTSDTFHVSLRDCQWSDFAGHRVVFRNTAVTFLLKQENEDIKIHIVWVKIAKSEYIDSKAEFVNIKLDICRKLFRILKVITDMVFLSHGKMLYDNLDSEEFENEVMMHIKKT
ncbi:hypothetical protein KAR91_01805 [Candidatus Pacearchaeota archaeon]|nr:hypothetical protein [Candidatus Pacearchaeota archaeon]